MIFVDSNVPMYLVGAPHPRILSFDGGFDGLPGIERIGGGGSPAGAAGR